MWKSIWRAIKNQMIEYGVTKSKGLTVYNALDQVRFIAYYKRKGGPVELSPELISEEINAIVKNTNLLIRQFVLILEGDADFLADWRNSVPEVDFQICISTKETLKNLKIKILDEDWKPGQEQISLNNLLST